MSDNGKAGHNAPFDKEVDVRTIYKAGGIIAVTAAVVGLLLVGLFRVFEGRDVARGKTDFELLRADNGRPLQDRLESIPSARLEGLEQEDNQMLLELTNEQRSRQWFYVDSSAYIERKGDVVPLYDLKEGTEVKVAYWNRDGRRVVSTITAPVSSESKRVGREKGLAFATGRIVELKPHTLRGWRAWALQQQDRFGWVDKDKKIVRTPVDDAFSYVLNSKEVKNGGKAAEPPPGLDRPTASSSGQPGRESKGIKK